MSESIAKSIEQLSESEVDMSCLVRRVRIYEKDHAPDGWPAVEMSMLTEMANQLEAARKDLKEAGDCIYRLARSNDDYIAASWYRSGASLPNG